MWDYDNVDNNEKSYQPTRSRGRGRGRNNFGRTNAKRYDKPNVECYNCHKYGHFSGECRTNVEEISNLVGDKKEDEEPTLLLSLNNEENNEKCLWYLDNGASNHMCGYKEKVVELEEKVKGNVSFGDSSKVKIQGKCTILISLKDGAHKIIKDVYYVPKLKKNILSLEQLLKKGYEVPMKDIVCGLKIKTLICLPRRFCQEIKSSLWAFRPMKQNA